MEYNNINDIDVVNGDVFIDRPSKYYIFASFRRKSVVKIQMDGHQCWVVECDGKQYELVYKHMQKNGDVLVTFDSKRESSDFVVVERTTHNRLWISENSHTRIGQQFSHFAARARHKNNK